MSKVTVGLTTGLLLAGLSVLAGCGACPRAPETEPPPPGCGPSGEMQSVTKYLPGAQGDCMKRNCSIVMVRKTAPKEVGVGQTFDYTIDVKNVCDATLYDVVVWDRAVDGFRMTMATPEVTAQKGKWATWELGTLQAGESRTITVEGMATSIGTLDPCAEVTYRMDQVCLSINVIEPTLKLEKMAPEQALQCDPIPIRMVVTNTGTGQACDVVVTDPLPDGWKTSDGQTTLQYTIGTLDPGESRQMSANVMADRTGTFTNLAFAEAQGGLRADAPQTVTLVTKPELSVSKTGPDMRYVGRPIEYVITVANGPQAAAENTVLVDTLPAGTSFVSASEGGSFSGNAVTWSFGTLQPRDSRTVSVTLTANSPGTLTNNASVTASCGRAATETTTRVEGIPAILLELIDLEDPIEVGAQTTYLVTVTNQGSAVDTNIRITATLPDEQSYVNAAGPTQATVDGQEVTFGPLPLLEPKAKATYRIVVKGENPGDVRFRVSLKSDQMSTQAMETEATRIYR